jgi:hypothetical protein
MSAVAALQFLQNRVVFGSLNSFLVYVNSDPAITIPGGKVTNIPITRAGRLKLRVSIDGYFSPWKSLKIKRGEVLSLAIVPSSNRSDRVLSLFGSDRSNYLRIELVSRASPGKSN